MSCSLQGSEKQRIPNKSPFVHFWAVFFFKHGKRAELLIRMARRRAARWQWARLMQ